MVVTRSDVGEWDHFVVETVENNVSAAQKLMLQEHLFFSPHVFQHHHYRSWCYFLTLGIEEINKKSYKQAFFHYLVIV